MTAPKQRIGRQSHSLGQKIWARLNSGAVPLQKIMRSSTSVEYRAWQHQFLSKRLRLCLWIALLCNLTFAGLNLYNYVLYPDIELVQESIKILGDPALYDRFKRLLLMGDWLTLLLLLFCLMMQRIPECRRYPGMIFLGMSWAITLAPEVLGTFMGLPVPGAWNFVFMAQVVLFPIHWQLHLLSQSVSILYYFGVNAILGLTQIPLASGLFSLESVFSAVWICLICDVAVYWYDRLQQQEFESRRELQVFLHAVTHDLRTPVIGASLVLQKLLRKAQASDDQVMITTVKLERLLAGSDRQLHLIDSILEAHIDGNQRLALHCQPLQLSSLVKSIIADSEALLVQNQVVLTNRVTDNLPLIYADSDQLWRVFSNLITNALKHNPPGINLTLNAELQTPQMLRCTIHDNGIGIPEQQQQRLFELYYRGTHSRYMPGLGMGLYWCQKIVTAHGGKIGVVSQPGCGSTFWFTLPLAPGRRVLN